MIDGIINLDDIRGKKFGFTSNLFDGYLWKKNNDIWISFIISKNKNQGNLSKLFNNILKEGYNIKVPTPFPLMEVILIKKGFNKTYEYDNKFGKVEVWFKGAKCKNQ